jgi:topoisomerase-4 subunit A
MKKFKLSEIQANAILDIRLRQLAKLEEESILSEKHELSLEAKDIEKTLGSASRLKTLIKNELKEDLEEFGDERNSTLTEVEESKAFDEKELISNDPMTVVLSQRGWIRAAKGHDVDAESLQYREGDGYLSSTKARNSQNAVILDNFGKAYSLPIHKLPSARGQGDPVSGSINAQSGATFPGVVAGNDEELCILATDAGYGFIAKIIDLQTKNKSGKAAINAKGAKPLDPKTIKSIEDSFIVSISSEGKMLLIEATDLPILSKGKGNKIISIDKGKHAANEDSLLFLSVLPKGASLKISSGKQHYVIKPNDLTNFVGVRGRKGNFLPKGFRRVENAEVLLPDEG